MSDGGADIDASVESGLDGPPSGPARSSEGIRAHGVRCLVGALLGMAVIALPLAQYTSVLVLLPDSPMLLQKLPPDDQPLPAQLLWSPWLYRLLTAVGGMPMAGALGVYIALVACAAYVAIRAINPTFRVTTGVDWDRTLLFRTYMHTAPLIKVIVVSVPTFVAAFAVWALVRAPFHGVMAQAALAGAVFGAAGWIALSRDGIIADCDSGNYQLPGLGDILGLAVRGAAVGVSVWLAIAAAVEASPERLVRFAVALGGAGERAWWTAAGGSLLLGALSGVVVAIAVGLMRPDGRAPNAEGEAKAGSLARLLVFRLALLAAVVGAFVISVTVWLPGHIRSRFDYDLRAATEVRPSWWRPDSAAERLVTLVAAGPLMQTTSEVETHEWRVRSVEPSGASGLHLGPSSMASLNAHLKRRRGRTALFRPATVAEYDRACLNMDVSARLKALIAAIQETGDPEFARVLVEDLGLLAGLPEAKYALTSLGRSSMFAYPTDDSRRPVGDLYAIHGDPTAARRWYELSGMPPDRAAERASRLVKVARSVVSGTVELRGSGCETMVGLIPAYGSFAQRIVATEAGPPIGPFELREVVRVGRPGRDGRFAIGNVQPGAYRLIVWLRPQKAAPQGASADLKVSRVSVSSDPASASVIECDGYSDVSVGRILVSDRQ